MANMKVNRRSRRFHDPWGTMKDGETGHVMYLGWRIGKVDIVRGVSVTNNYLVYFDGTKQLESCYDRIVKGGRVECLRK